MSISDYSQIIDRYDNKIKKSESFNADEMVELGSALILSDPQKEKIKSQFRNLQDSYSNEQKIQCVEVALLYINKKAKELKLEVPHFEKIPLKLWLQKEAKTQKELERWLFSTLGIILTPAAKQQPPTPEGEKIYDAMRKFCTHSWKKNWDDVTTLRSQQELPLMQKCFNELKESYAEWPSASEDKNDLNKLKEKIKIQQDSILKLSKILAYLTPMEKAQKDRLTGILTTDRFNELGLDPFIAGTRTLTYEETKEIKTRLEQMISRDLQLEEERPARPKKSRITETAVTKQAKLESAVIEAKQWGYEKKKLTPLGTSQNPVYALQPSDSTVSMPKPPAAFFKKSWYPLEKVAWDIACIFGMEKFFTATKMTEAPTKKSLEGGTEKKVFWKKTPEGLDLETKTTGKKERMRGGIQANIGGISLEDYVMKPAMKTQDIKRGSLIDATLALCVFGMRDAHTANIWVNAEGEPQFFDVADSFLHSNGGILTLRQIDPNDPSKRELQLLPTIRSAFLLLDASYDPLTTVEREEIRQKLLEIRGKIPELEAHFNDLRKRRGLSEMTPLEFNQTAMISALNERLDLMLQAIDNPRVVNLRDFTLASQPNVRFYAALAIAVYTDPPYTTTPSNLLSQKMLEEYQKVPLAMMGPDDVMSMLVQCSEKGINPSKIKQLCADKNLSFDEITREIIRLLQLPDSKKDNVQKSVEDGQKIAYSLAIKAKIDFKDVNPGVKKKYLANVLDKMSNQNAAVRYFDKNTFFVAAPNDDVVIKQLARPDNPPLYPIAYLVVDSYPYRFKIAYKALDGTIHQFDATLDGSTRISFGSMKAMDPSKLASVFSTPKVFCMIDRANAENILNSNKTKYPDYNLCLMRPSQLGGIAVSFVDPKTKEVKHARYLLIPDRPNVVIDEKKPPKEYTLEELEKSWIERGFSWIF